MAPIALHRLQWLDGPRVGLRLRVPRRRSPPATDMLYLASSHRRYVESPSTAVQKPSCGGRAARGDSLRMHPAVGGAICVQLRDDAGRVRSSFRQRVPDDLAVPRVDGGLAAASGGHGRRVSWAGFAPIVAHHFHPVCAAHGVQLPLCSRTGKREVRDVTVPSSRAPHCSHGLPSLRTVSQL